MGDRAGGAEEREHCRDLPAARAKESLHRKTPESSSLKTNKLQDPVSEN
jgi:hypothetical protein